MKTAYSLIREQPVYRKQAFTRGLASLGYHVREGLPPSADHHGDVLLMWNRYGHLDAAASNFEDRGGTVLVAENAYMANDRANRMRYAIAVHGHNGSGFWPQGDGSRWAALGLQPQPWRTSGEHVLVAPNRGFGSSKMLMHPMWPKQTLDLLKLCTRRPIKLRPHPGNELAKVPFERDLENAWAVVIWSSSVGCDALLAGVPVFCMANYWICKSATLSTLKQIETPMCDDAKRLRAFEALAWAQWHITEIESGEAFSHLLNRPQAFCGGL